MPGPLVLDGPLEGSGREKCRRVKPDGVRCGNWPIRGGTVCVAHGGRSPATAAAAQKRLAEAAVVKVVEVSTKRRVGALVARGDLSDPYQALLDVAGRTVVWMERVGEMVEELESIRYRGAVSEQMRAEAELYGTLLKDSAQVLATISRLNLDARLVRIREEQARMVQQAVEKGLRAAGVYGEALQRARVETAKYLRVIS